LKLHINIQLNKNKSNYNLAIKRFHPLKKWWASRVSSKKSSP